MQKTAIYLNYILLGITLMNGEPESGLILMGLAMLVHSGLIFEFCTFYFLFLSLSLTLLVLKCQETSVFGLQKWLFQRSGVKHANRPTGQAHVVSA
jgi:hypothetical protein